MNKTSLYALLLLLLFILPLPLVKADLDADTQSNNLTLLSTDYYGIDSDDDGLYEYLTFETTLDVQQYEEFSITAVLMHESGKEIPITENDYEKELFSGTNTIIFDFPGYHINELGVDNPYTLRVVFEGTYGNDFMIEKNISFDQIEKDDFDTFPIGLTGDYLVYGNDEDNDSIFESLIVEFEINITDPDEYTFDGYTSANILNSNTAITDHYDIGIHTIQLAFEGAGIYSSKKDGPYKIEIDIKKSSKKYQIHEFILFSPEYSYYDFVRPVIRFTRYLNHTTYLDENSGLYDSLAFNIGLDVKQSGTYKLRSYILVPGGTIIAFRDDYILEEGIYDIEKIIDGVRIFRNGEDGTFSILELEIQDNDSVIDRYPVVSYETDEFNHSDFKRPCALFTGELFSYGEDSDDDGLYDWLIVDIGVHTTKPNDTYILSGDLYGHIGEKRVNIFDNDEITHTFFPEEENTTVQLKIDGEELYRRGIDGPYILKRLAIENLATRIIQDEYNEYFLPDFSIEEFEHQIEDDSDDEVDETGNSIETKKEAFTISDLDVEIDGEDSDNLEDGDKISDEAKPGSSVDFNIEIENLLQDSKLEDINIEITIKDIDDGDDMDRDDWIDEIDENEKEDIEISFNIPDEVEKGDYDIVIDIDAIDENATSYALSWNLEIEIEREKHSVEITDFSLSEDEISCQNYASLSIIVKNQGSSDEHVDILIENEDLDVHFEETGIRLDDDQYDDDNIYENTYYMDFSKTKEGTYPISITVMYSGKTVKEFAVLTVDECFEKTVEKKETLGLSNFETIYASSSDLQMVQIEQNKEGSISDHDGYLMLFMIGIIILAGIILFLFMYLLHQAFY